MISTHKCLAYTILTHAFVGNVVQEEYNAISRQLILAQQHIDQLQGEVLAKKNEALNAKGIGAKIEVDKMKQV
jgi:hypothetical protein